MNTADLYLKPWETRHCEPPLDPPDEYWGIDTEEENDSEATRPQMGWDLEYEDWN